MTILSTDLECLNEEPWEDSGSMTSNFRRQCPAIKVECEEVMTTALVDTGCMTSVISKIYSMKL